MCLLCRFLRFTFCNLFCNLLFLNNKILDLCLTLLLVNLLEESVSIVMGVTNMINYRKRY